MNPLESQEAIEFLKNLSKEDKKSLQNCQRDGFLVGCFWSFTCYAYRHAQSYLTKKPFTPGSFGLYVTAFTAGYLTYTPLCLSRAVQNLRSKKLEYNKKGSAFASQLPVPIEENTSFQSTVNPDLDDPDSGFSHLSLDYNPNPADQLILIDEEEKPQPKFQTTYEDLRKENRKSYWVRDEAPVKSSSYPVREVPSKPAELPKQVRTNQYGDPIEY